jgi:hypothetical protein
MAALSESTPAAMTQSRADAAQTRWNSSVAKNCTHES